MRPFSPPEPPTKVEENRRPFDLWVRYRKTAERIKTTPRGIEPWRDSFVVDFRGLEASIRLWRL
jgi:hypothetical protein